MAKICRTTCNRQHFGIVQPTTYSTLGVYDSRLPLATVDTCTCGKLPGTLALSLFWVQCPHAQLNSFYHLFYPNVTHMRKDTRQAAESWLGSCTRLNIHHKEAPGAPIRGAQVVIEPPEEGSENDLEEILCVWDRESCH